MPTPDWLLTERPRHKRRPGLGGWRQVGADWSWAVLPALGPTSVEWLEEWPQRLAAVTSADVQRVARAWFAPSKQTVGWYVPNDDAVAGEEEAAGEEGDDFDEAEFEDETGRPA